ncbi:hypothetical protein [Mycolicibacterium arseniciresistens]|uniref:DUF4352 domain-containing protein n=1 Tax=Mycolicibacterium arseniciresistens TaxID=3062257 RepID=A0ABT8U8P2_9MYCO|nr:hypothetical protein [Mycolicibacterium arseniciresistens]MDO3634164.1 hypothetical protein [Mycolicibacterium arseniciresistens]
MSRTARIGVGVAVVAALALGRAIDTVVPAVTDTRPFEHSGGVGDRVRLAYADITVDAVHIARRVDNGSRRLGSPGRWLVVDATVVARGRPLATPGVWLHDARGRTFSADPRSGYAWVPAPTGVRWRVRIPFEIPEDALAGAMLTWARNTKDDRRDDVAQVDLGIDRDEAAELWHTDETIEITEPGIVAS